MQLRRGVLLGRPFGIPLLIHGSWFPAAILLICHFVLTVYADMRTVPAVMLGVVSAVAFFGSLVAHELGHSLMARSMGIGVRDITLFIFGGVARIVREPSRPAQEIVIALAGPAVSAGLGIALLSLAGATGGIFERFFWTIGAANLALAIFNMLPGFPLDGGRVLRAVLWARSGDPFRSAVRAGRVGQTIGLILVVGGIGVFLGTGSERITEGAAEGLWLAVVGAFLHVLATGSRRAARVAAALRDQSAYQWARPFGGTLPADAALSIVRRDGGAPFAVSDGGRLAGILLPGANGHARLVREAMVPWTPRLTFPAAQPLSRALERLAGSDSGLLVLVDEAGSAVGVLDHDGVRARLRRGRKPVFETQGTT